MIPRKKGPLDPEGIVTSENFWDHVEKRGRAVESIIKKQEEGYKLAEEQTVYFKKMTEKNDVESLRALNFHKIFPDVNPGGFIKEIKKIEFKERKQEEIDERKLLATAQKILGINLQAPLMEQQINWAKNSLPETFYLNLGPHKIPAVGAESNLCAGLKEDGSPCHKTRKTKPQSLKKKVKFYSGLQQEEKGVDCYCDCLAEVENARRHAARKYAPQYLDEKINSYNKILEEAKKLDENTREELEHEKRKQTSISTNRLRSTQHKFAALTHFLASEGQHELDLYKTGIIKVQLLPHPSAPMEIKEGEVDEKKEPGMASSEFSHEQTHAAKPHFPKTHRLLQSLFKQIFRLLKDDSRILSSGADKAYYIIAELMDLLAQLDNQQKTDDEFYAEIKASCIEGGSLYSALTKKRSGWFCCGIFSIFTYATDTELAIKETIRKIDGEKFFKSSFVMSRSFLSQIP